MYPKMLIMRNSRGGCIWQAYIVENFMEEVILTYNAQRNWFVVEQEKVGYTSETTPGWRNTEEWKQCLPLFTRKM